MPLMLAALLLAPSAPIPSPSIPPVKGVLLQASGKCDLHVEAGAGKLDFPLSAKPEVPGAIDLAQHLIPQKLAGNRFRILGAKMSPLLALVHDVRWKSGENAKYEAWRGGGAVRTRLLTRSVSVPATVTQEANGNQIIKFDCRITTTDEGTFTERQGPNSWIETWTHKLSGKLTVDEKNRVLDFEMTDEFDIRGQLHAGNRVAVESYTQKGKVTRNVIITL